MSVEFFHLILKISSTRMICGFCFGAPHNEVNGWFNVYVLRAGYDLMWSARWTHGFLFHSKFELSSIVYILYIVF
jgi:hypothetical protein